MPGLLPRWLHGGQDAPLRRRDRTLFRRVLMHGFMLLILTALSVVAVMALVGQRPEFRHYAERGGRYLADRQQEVWSDPAGRDAELERARRELGLQMSVYRMDGSLVATNIHPPLPALEPSRHGLLAADAHHLGWRTGGVIAPIRVGGQLVGYTITMMHQVNGRIARGLAALLAIMATIALMSVPLAHSIAAPLERLTATARKLGQGELTARSGLVGSDEMGQLGRAFDEMAERLQALVRREKELLADVSHELRTPMARIRVALEMAAEADAAPSRRYLEEIGEDLGELERLVEDVLTTARLELATGRTGDGAPPLRRSIVDPAVLLQRASERFRQAHPERALEVETTGSLPAIDADPELLRRALDNLLDNARKYSDAPIVLRARGVEAGLRARGGGSGAGHRPGGSGAPLHALLPHRPQPHPRHRRRGAGTRPGPADRRSARGTHHGPQRAGRRQRLPDRGAAAAASAS